MQPYQSFGTRFLWLLLLLLLVTTKTVVAQGDGTTSIDCGGCNDCTAAILDTVVDPNGAFTTCGAKILDRINAQGESPQAACAAVSEFYPLQCGPDCHPNKCDGKAPPLCNCAECTPEVWNADAGSFSCGQRVRLNTQTKTELEACADVATSFPEECGACHPETCPSNTAPPTGAPPTPAAPPATDAPTTTASTKPTAAPTVQKFCGCAECTAHWNASVGASQTCGSRIRNDQDTLGFTEEEACRRQAEQFPYICGPGCDPDKCDDKSADFCGCSNCTLTMLQEDAEGHTCASRISEVRRNSNVTEIEACRTIANQYAACRVNAECNPNVCDGGINALRSSDESRSGEPWAWAILSVNAVICIGIFVAYRKW